MWLLYAAKIKVGVNPYEALIIWKKPENKKKYKRRKEKYLYSNNLKKNIFINYKNERIDVLEGWDFLMIILKDGN